MKQLSYILFVLCLTLSACEIETSNNGQLDGNWQLRTIDTLQTGGICDMSRSYIYWSVENNLLQLRDIDNSNLKILFRFEKKGDQLNIHSPFKVITKDELEPLEDDEVLRPFGIYGTTADFAIEQLNSSRLVLRNEDYRFHFRKY